MAVVEVHISVYAPEKSTAVAQALIRERVPSVPEMLDSLREIDWQQVRDVMQALTDDCAKRVLAQMGSLEEFLEIKGAVPGDSDEESGNGAGG